jgi:membrane protein YdbS with pleckstrin-like domain
VNDLFAPPGTEWQPVSPALARLRQIVLLAVGGVLLIVLVVATMLLSLPWEVWLPVLVVTVSVLAVAWFMVDRNAQSWGFAEREEDLYVKHGATFRRLVVVPYGRMQYVDIQAGPLEQAFKVASVHLHTASPGTSARIPGLPASEAARLRDRLTALGESQAAGL